MASLKINLAGLPSVSINVDYYANTPIENLKKYGDTNIPTDKMEEVQKLAQAEQKRLAALAKKDTAKP